MRTSEGRQRYNAVCLLRSNGAFNLPRHDYMKGGHMAKVQFLVDSGDDGMMLLGDVRDMASVPNGGETTTIDGDTYNVVGEMPGDGSGGIVEVVVQKV